VTGVVHFTSAREANIKAGILVAVSMSRHKDEDLMRGRH